MKERMTSLAVVAILALMVTPAQAENFWDNLKKDFKGLTGAIKDGIGDVTEGKKEVEEVVEDAEQLQEEFTGPPEDEPRYDSTWVAELQQRLAAQGFDPGPIDGAFGNRTSRAISAFQRRAGINQDGLPRPTVMRALRARTQGVQTAQPPPQPQPSQPQQFAGAIGGTQVGREGMTAIVAPGSASFELAPEPDYHTLLEMLIGADPDSFNSPEFALYYASLQLPPFPQQPCADFVNGLGNEISRRRMTEEAQAALNAVLAVSPRTDQVRTFRVTTRDSANEYDFGRGGFPVNTTYSSSPFRGDWAYRSQLGHQVCTHKADGRYFGQYDDHRLEVPVPVQTGEWLLAMAPERAQGFIDRNRSRHFETEWLIEVRATANGLTGRVVAARARERRGGPILHEFDPALFQPPAVDPSATLAATLAPPVTPYVVTLHALQRIPDLLDRQQLIELTRVQVESDQRAYNPELASTTRDTQPVFAREQVEGRLPALAAEELAFAYREYLSELAAGAPARLRAEHRLQQLVYDSASGMLRCCEHYRQETLNLLIPAGGSGGQETPRGIPESVEPLAHYRIERNSPGGDQGPSAGIRNGIQRRYLPGIDVLALDRRLEMKGIPLDRARAEELLLELRQGRSRDGLTAIVEFTVEDVRRDPPQARGPSAGAMVARLDQVIIRGPNDAEVARFPAETFRRSTAPEAKQPPAESGTPAPSHQRLTLAYLASQPELIDDPAFAQRYAAITDCDAWRENRDDEFARADLGRQAREQMRAALAQGAGGSSDTHYRISIEAELGEYAFGEQRFPLAVPVFDQSIYRDLLDAPQPAVLIEPDGKSCRRYSVASPSIPDAFLLTLANAEAIESVGVPSDTATARAFLQRDLPPYRDPRAVRIEMVVAVGAISPPQRTHPQRDERVSVVPGTVVSARVLDAHSERTVFDYGTDLFGSAPAPAAEPAAVAVTSAVPEGAEFVLVSVADPTELEAYAVIEGSGLDLAKGERIKGKFVLRNYYDEMTDLWAVLKSSPRIGIALSADRFAEASADLAGLDLKVEAYRPGGEATDEPKLQRTAALTVVPPTAAPADERGAEAFKVLNVTVGMTEPEVRAAIAGEFAPDQITTDPASGMLLATKGACNDTDPADPAIASEAGAFCLELQFADGVVSRVALRQVVPGDVAARALAAFRERYGEPAFEQQSRPHPSVERSVIGWGRPLSNSAMNLAGIDADAPRTVLEGRVWRSNGVTVAVLHLDDGRAAQGSDGLAAGQEIKF